MVWTRGVVAAHRIRMLVERFIRKLRAPKGRPVVPNITLTTRPETWVEGRPLVSTSYVHGREIGKRRRIN